MVQKYQSPVRVYKYPFELVMAAYELRFPTCDMIPVVKETEIIHEEVSEDDAVHVIDRRAKLSIDVPYLLKKIMGVEFLLFRQKNTLDKRNRTLTIDAWNESFSHRVVINELCLYSVHPENPDWTCFEQNADLDIKSFFGFEGSAEKVAINEYSKNIAKSKDIMEHYIKVLADQGITHIAIWEESKKSDDDDDDGSKDEPEDGDTGVAEGGAAMAIPKTSSTTVRRKSSAMRGTLSTSPNAGGITEGIADGLHISEDTKHKLEQDYIHMYLGELTPMQESQLVQLKMKVSELLKGKVPSDPVFLRFLRAREFQVEKAREMLSSSLLWRKKHGVDKILSEYEKPPVVREYFPGGWHHYDKEGRPLFILRLGQMDVKGIVKSVGEEGLTKLVLHICEEGLRLTEEAAHRLNKPISTWCLLLDLEGLNMRHLWRPGMKALLHIIEICEANYPETLGRVLIIRAPRVFPILWTLVSPLIDEKSREKFLFYGGNDYQNTGGLVDYINPEFIPDWLGGPYRIPEIPEGGLVPKSYYMSVEEFVKDQSPGPHPLLEETFYHSTSLVKGQVHEGLVHISERGTVITWDFDVIRHDVVFTVYRLRDSLPPIHSPRLVAPTAASTSTTATAVAGDEKSDATAATLKASSTSESGGGAFPFPPKEAKDGAAATTATGGGAPSTSSSATTTGTAGYHEPSTKSVIDKSMKEHADYYKVENSIVCHEGESIQGSHVTSHTGTYILQWKFYDGSLKGSSLHRDAHHHQTLTDAIADTITQHKAKIMYYYETLNSSDYKGSMTSLQSCHSAFSTISKASQSALSSSGVSSAHSEEFVSSSNSATNGKGQKSTMMASGGAKLKQTS